MIKDCSVITLLLLALIYLSFVSLGLPDSLLGACWPVMYADLQTSYENAGYISATVCLGTVISSLIYAKVSKLIRTRTVTTFSVFMTALALFLISRASSILALVPCALLLGLGAGAIDASLNNYVVLHYKARHVSFLHAFWGIGTIVGPLLLSRLIASGGAWRAGYLSVSALQFTIGIILLCSLKAWDRAPWAEEEKAMLKKDEGKKSRLWSYRELIGSKGTKPGMLGFFLYCSGENTAMLWTASFLVFSKGLSEARGALCVSFLYIGITAGRLASGFVSERLGDLKMVFLGIGIAASGAFGMLFFSSLYALGLYIFLLGFGFGPIYPSMMHQTPFLVGYEKSSSVISLEMASAYIGSLLMPFAFGKLSSLFSTGILPIYVLCFLFCQIFVTLKKRKLL